MKYSVFKLALAALELEHTLWKKGEYTNLHQDWNRSYKTCRQRNKAHTYKPSYDLTYSSRDILHMHERSLEL